MGLVEDTKERDDSPGPLRGRVFGKATRDRLDEFETTKKAIADYVGTAYSHEMLCLVTYGEEITFKEPEMGEKATSAENLRYRQYLENVQSYAEYKGKVFTTVLGRCTEPVRNKIEAKNEFKSMQIGRDVLGLLGMIKDIACGADEKQYPPMQAVAGLKALMNVRQDDKESDAKYYRRFMALLEHVERVFGALEPRGLISLEDPDPNMSIDLTCVQEETKAERQKMLAYLFLCGSKSWLLNKELKNSHVLGISRYPTTIEDALELVQRYERKSGSDAGGTKTSLAQDFKGVCWECGETGHQRNACPKVKAEEEDDKKKEGANAAQHSDKGSNIIESPWTVQMSQIKRDIGGDRAHK